MTGLALGPLDNESTVSLLRRRLGTFSPTAAELESLAKIAGNLPLAVDMITGQINAEPDWSVSDHLERLERAGTDVAPALDLTYSQLNDVTRHLLNLLALHPARLNEDEMSALLDGWATSGPQALAELTLEHLVTQDLDGRYDLHDVVRDHAIKHTWDVEAYSALQSDVERLARYLLERSAHAVEQWAPSEMSTFRSPEADAAREWLEAHAEVVVTTVQLAADFGLAELVSTFSELLAEYLHRHQRWGDAFLVHRAAVSHGLPGRQGMAKLALGDTLRWLGRYGEAQSVLSELMVASPAVRYRALYVMIEVHSSRGAIRESLKIGEEALAEAQRFDDADTEMAIHASMGFSYHALGDYEKAKQATSRFLEIAREMGRSVEIALGYCYLGGHALPTGELDYAARQADLALELVDERTPASVAGWAKFIRGQARVMSGDLSGIDEVEECYHVFRESQPGPLECEGLLALALCRLGRGEIAQSRLDFEAARRMAQRLAAPRLIAKALNGYGFVQQLSGEHEAARASYTEALDVGRRVETALEIGRSLVGLADLAHARGEDDRARGVLMEALGMEHLPPYVEDQVRERFRDWE